MKVLMKSYMTLKDGTAYKPGDVAEFDDKEGKRVIEVGGADAYEAPAEEPKSKK